MDAAVYESLQKEALPSQLTAANEMLDAYVTDIQGTPADPNAYHMQWDGSSGDLTLSQSQDGAYNVVFTIEGTVKDNLTSELGTQEIRVGKTHIVKTTTFELEGGCIISCERLADEAQKAKEDPTQTAPTRSGLFFCKKSEEKTRNFRSMVDFFSINDRIEQQA